jgi:hypothetical protein
MMETGFLVKKDAGGIQRPVAATPGENFDVGKVTNEDRVRIALATPRPLFVQASSQDGPQPRDQLKLTALVNEALLEVSSRGQEATLVYADAVSAHGRRSPKREGTWLFYGQ